MDVSVNEDAKVGSSAEAAKSPQAGNGNAKSQKKRKLDKSGDSPPGAPASAGTETAGEWRSMIGTHCVDCQPISYTNHIDCKPTFCTNCGDCQPTFFVTTIATASLCFISTIVTDNQQFIQTIVTANSYCLHQL